MLEGWYMTFWGDGDGGGVWGAGLSPAATVQIWPSGERAAGRRLLPMAGRGTKKNERRKRKKLDATAGRAQSMQGDPARGEGTGRGERTGRGQGTGRGEIENASQAESTAPRPPPAARGGSGAQAGAGQGGRPPRRNRPADCTRAGMRLARGGTHPPRGPVVREGARPRVPQGGTPPPPPHHWGAAGNQLARAPNAPPPSATPLPPPCLLPQPFFR